MYHVSAIADYFTCQRRHWWRNTVYTGPQKFCVNFLTKNWPHKVRFCQSALSHICPSNCIFSVHFKTYTTQTVRGLSSTSAVTSINHSCSNFFISLFSSRLLHHTCDLMSRFHTTVWYSIQYV